MSDDMASMPIPKARFSFKNTDWKTQTCGNCEFLVEAEKRKASDPDVFDCRESPPSLFAAPGLNALKQPILQLVNKYPGLPQNFPACSKFVEKIKTAN